MDCRTVRRYLAMYLDSELGPETTFEIASHLDECADCRRVAEQEERLENSVRSALIAPHPNDDAIWARATAQFGASRVGRRAPVVAIGIAGVAIAATIALLFIIGAPWTYDELDLAEITAAEHMRVLNRDGLRPNEEQKVGELGAFFRRELSPAYCLNLESTDGMRLIKAGICEISDVRTAHVVCADSETVVSLFWLPADAIAAFPETVDRFGQHGPAFHCHVDPYEFFVKRSGAGIIVGIAKTTPAILEDCVQRASKGGCQNGM